MEFKLITPKEGRLSNPIEFNFEELKTEIQNQMAKYQNLAYTKETLKEAKMTRADLNRFKTALENERKRIKSEYLKPYLQFETKVKALVSLVDVPIKEIDTQIKSLEEKKKKSETLYTKKIWIKGTKEELKAFGKWLKDNDIEYGGIE